MTAVQKSSDKSEFETPFNGEIQGAQLQPVFDQFTKGQVTLCNLKRSET